MLPFSFKIIVILAGICICQVCDMSICMCVDKHMTLAQKVTFIMSYQLQPIFS